MPVPDREKEREEMRDAGRAPRRPDSVMSGGSIAFNPVGGGVPDPTLLTTVQLDARIASLDELFKSRLNGIEDALALFRESITRVPTDTDKQVGQLKELTFGVFAERGKTFDEKLNVINERLHSIQMQFTERDRRQADLSTANKIGVETALQAQKEQAAADLRAQKEAAAAQNYANTQAAAKSEAAFAKLIEQLSAHITEMRRNQENTIADLKSRLDKGEGRQPHEQRDMALVMQEIRNLGSAQNRDEGRSANTDKTVAYMIAGVSAIIAVLGVTIPLLTRNPAAVAIAPVREAIDQTTLNAKRIDDIVTELRGMARNNNSKP